MTRWIRTGLSRDMVRQTFSEYLGVGPEPADVLVSLYEVQGAPIPARDICVSLSSHRPLRLGALHERVRVLREAMDTEAIDSDQGAYSLTDVGLEECRRALREMAKAMVGDGFELPPDPRPIRKLRPKTVRISALQLRLFEDAS